MSSQQKKISDFLNVFPYFTEEEARQFLENANWDVQRAVNIAIGSPIPQNHGEERKKVADPIVPSFPKEEEKTDDKELIEIYEKYMGN